VSSQGAPLAYTPFCDNNKDMDGFRFWKQGFWQSHLKERPYHISALYVVDLAKFRSAPCTPPSPLGGTSVHNSWTGLPRLSSTCNGGRGVVGVSCK